MLPEIALRARATTRTLAAREAWHRGCSFFNRAKSARRRRRRSRRRPTAYRSRVPRRRATSSEASRRGAHRQGLPSLTIQRAERHLPASSEGCLGRARCPGDHREVAASADRVGCRKNRGQTIRADRWRACRSLLASPPPWRDTPAPSQACRRCGHNWSSARAQGYHRAACSDSARSDPAGRYPCTSLHPRSRRTSAGTARPRWAHTGWGARPRTTSRASSSRRGRGRRLRSRQQVGEPRSARHPSCSGTLRHRPLRTRKETTRRGSTTCPKRSGFRGGVSMLRQARTGDVEGVAGLEPAQIRR